jgi:hypothetical protein
LGAWMFNGVYMFSCVCVACLGRGLATSWSPVQGVLPPVYRLGNWNKKRPRPTRAVEPLKKKIWGGESEICASS